METTTIELAKTAVAAMAGCLIVVVAMSLGSERFLVWRGKRRFESRMKDKIRGAMHEKEIYLAKFEYAYGISASATSGRGRFRLRSASAARSSICQPTRFFSVHTSSRPASSTSTSRGRTSAVMRFIAGEET